MVKAQSAGAHPAPKLRDYQSSAIDRVTAEWRRGVNRVCLVLPVGGGKTLTAAEIVRRVIDASARGDSDCDAFFLGHRAELVEQPSRAFRKLGIPHGVVKAGVRPSASYCRKCSRLHEVRPARCPCGSLDVERIRVQVATPQTLARRDLSLVNDQAGRVCFLIPDEAHRYLAQDMRRVTRELGQQYDAIFLLGLTATPYRLDGKDISDMFETLIEGATTPQLISEGHITEGLVVGRPPPTRPDLRAVGEDGEFQESAAEAAMDTPKLLGDAVDTWRKHCDGRPGIGRCTSKNSAMRRAERFAAAGFRVGYLDGETPKRERRLLLARLAIGGQHLGHPAGLDVLLFQNVLTEGFDSESSYELLQEPDVRRAIWPSSSAPPPYQPLQVVGDYCPTQSMGAFIQLWGRGSRTHRDKLWLRFLSHAGNEDEHCWLSQHHGFSIDHDQKKWKSELRKREAEQAVPTTAGSGVARVVCKECGTRWLPGTTECLHCGSVDLGLATRREVYGDESGEEAPGELVQKVADKEAPRPPTPSELDRWLESQFRKLREENAVRLSSGRAARKPGSIWHIYCGIFKKEPPREAWTRALVAAGYGRRITG